MIKFIQKQLNKDGFTLVELIIVIAVMAILASIVVPRMAGITTSFKEKADERVCEQLARAIEVKVQIGALPAVTTFTDLTLAQVGETTAIEPKSVSTNTFKFAYDADDVYVYVDAPTTAALADSTAFDDFTGIKYTKEHGGEIE